MKDRSVFESTLLEILEEKNSDQNKAKKLIPILKSIKRLNHLYRRETTNLQKRKIMMEDKNPFISLEFSDKGKTPLIIAAANGDVQCLKLLLKAGANMESDNYDQHTPLMVAAKNGHVNCVSLLVKSKAKINAIARDCNHDETALMLAAQQGHAKVLQVLINSKADCTYTSSHYPKNDAFMLAAKGGHTDCVRLLMDKVDINKKNEARESAIEYAINGKYDELLQFLVHSNEIDIEQHLSWWDRASLLAISRNNLPALKILIDGKADIHYVFNNQTLISFAASCHFDSAIPILSQAGVDINAKNKYHETALMHAALNGDLNMISALVKAGATITGEEINYVMRYYIDPKKMASIATLLQLGSKMTDPAKFYKYINSGKISDDDPNLIYCYEIIYENFKKNPIVDHHGKKCFQMDNLVLGCQEFIDFIIELTQPLKKAKPYWQLETVKQLEQCSALKSVPSDILNIVALYDDSIGKAALSNQNTEYKIEPYIKNLENRVKDNKTAEKQIRFFSSQCGLNIENTSYMPQNSINIKP